MHLESIRDQDSGFVAKAYGVGLVFNCGAYLLYWFERSNE